MRAESQIKEMNDELRAIKAAYEQATRTLILYEYILDIEDEYFISRTVTLDTQDGSNALAFVEGATYDRMPYEGGAKFFLRNRQAPVLKIHSMQRGTVTIYD